VSAFYANSEVWKFIKDTLGGAFAFAEGDAAQVRTRERRLLEECRAQYRSDLNRWSIHIGSDPHMKE
jgi:hypothetical protein